MTTNPAPGGAPSDWPYLLRRDLLPRVQAIREVAARCLGESAAAPEFFRKDAEHLDQAGGDLLENTRYLVSLGSMPAGAEAALLVHRASHALLNILNRVTGYSQLLLEADDVEQLPPLRQDLERACELSQECERVIHEHLASNLAAPTPIPVTEELASAEARKVASATILVVDDDPAIRATLVRALAAQGHTLEESPAGPHALERLRQGSFDLVLLDIELPGIDGYEVLRLLRGEVRLQSLPVLMMSGRDPAVHMARCLEAGAEDFLSKPINHALLRARVNLMLLRRQARLRELEQFFPPEVARQLIDRPEVLEEGTQTTISVLFCDIRGYSRISRRLGPGDTVEWVSSVMEELTERILNNNGVLVDFIGDELLAMWGAPALQPDHAERACHTALEMFACLPDLNKRWQDKLGESMDFGIGINSGIAWVGNSGTRRKFKYGPSGDTVNVGSRVQGATKYLKAPLIVSRATHDQLEGKFHSRRLAKVRVVNIAEPVELFEVVAPGVPHWEELRRGYEEALALYEERKLAEAARRLGGLIAGYGAAGPPLSLMARTLEGLLDRGRWDPVLELPGK